MGKYHSNGGEVADTTWADACSEKECGIEWVPLTDRTNAEDRMEPGKFVGFRMKSSEYILIANGEATTARTIRRRPVPERWTNLEEIVNTPVWPWDRPGHRQAAAVRPMGERRDRNHEPDEALLPKPPAEAGPSKSVYLKQSDFDAHGLTQGCPGNRAMREGIRAQGHSAICRARREELLRGTAKGQQRQASGPPNESSSSSPTDQQIP